VAIDTTDASIAGNCRLEEERSAELGALVWGRRLHLKRFEVATPHRPRSIGQPARFRRFLRRRSAATRGHGDGQ